MNSTTIRKLANAFIRPSRIGEAVEEQRGRGSGIWVGGVVEIDDQAISFKANVVMNEMLTEADLARVIPLSAVRGVRWEFGWLSGIVVVDCGDGSFRFRCFGAKGVVKALSSRLALRRPAA